MTDSTHIWVEVSDTLPHLFRNKAEVMRWVKECGYELVDEDSTAMHFRRKQSLGCTHSDRRTVERRAFLYQD